VIEEMEVKRRREEGKEGRRRRRGRRGEGKERGGGGGEEGKEGKERGGEEERAQHISLLLIPVDNSIFNFIEDDSIFFAEPSLHTVSCFVTVIL
jgi:hypothetical protein